MTLINIAKTDEKPLYIEASDITELSIDREKDEMVLFNSKGPLLVIGCKEWDVDPDAVVQKLADNGRSLIYFPTRWPSGENGALKEYPAYVAPEALLYATVSAPSKEGKISIIFGLEGFGRKETYGMSQQEVDALLDAANAARKLMKFFPEQVHSRWYEPAALYVDPKAVTQIEDDGLYQVQLHFGNLDKIDVQETVVDRADRKDEIANEIYRREPALDIKDIFREAARLQRKEESDARARFANAVAAANGTLIAVPCPGKATHVRKEDIVYVSMQPGREGGYDLGLHPQRGAANKYASPLYFHYETKKECEEAFKAVNKALQPAPKKPEPPKSWNML